MTSAVFVSRGLVAFSSTPPQGQPPIVGGRSTWGADVRWGGNRRIDGTVKNTGTPNTPVYRRVRLHDQISGQVVRETWSDAATGAFSFDHIAPGVYYVTTFDHTNQYNGEVATDLVAEPMVSP